MALGALAMMSFAVLVAEVVVAAAVVAAAVVAAAVKSLELIPETGKEYFSSKINHDTATTLF